MEAVADKQELQLAEGKYALLSPRAILIAQCPIEVLCFLRVCAEYFAPTKKFYRYPNNFVTANRNLSPYSPSRKPGRGNLRSRTSLFSVLNIVFNDCDISALPIRYISPAAKCFLKKLLTKLYSCDIIQLVQITQFTQKRGDISAGKFHGQAGDIS